MTTMRGVGERFGGGNGRQYSEQGARNVDVRQLDAESQRAHELLKALSDLGEHAGRKKIIASAGASEPLTPRALTAIATYLARLDIPLTPKGIARFKADRGLVGGSGLAGSVARAYVRAVAGGEVLFRIDRKEELDLRPAEKAALAFLRQLARNAGAEAVGRLKEALGLGNPPTPTPEAQALMNEYIGVNTVKEVAQQTARQGVALTSDAVKAFVERIEADKAAAAGDAPAAAPAKPVKPMTATPMPAPSAAAAVAAPTKTAPSRPGLGLKKG